MMAKFYRRFGWLLIASVFTWMSGCGDGTSTNSTTTEPTINPATLDSAAAFLAAATGKENPIEIDQVVFVNSVLGINQPEPTTASVAADGQDTSMGCLYGDLWVMLRDDNGVPVLDEQGCEQPIASQPIELLLFDENNNPVLDENDVQLTYFSDTVPMSLEEYMDH
jgi:hypothetical protein